MTVDLRRKAPTCKQKNDLRRMNLEIQKNASLSALMLGLDFSVVLQRDVTIRKNQENWRVLLLNFFKVFQKPLTGAKAISKAFMQLQVCGRGIRNKNILKTKKVACSKQYHWQYNITSGYEEMYFDYLEQGGVFTRQKLH